MCHAREHPPKLGGPGNDQVIMNPLSECKVLGVVSVMMWIVQKRTYPIIY